MADHLHQNRKLVAHFSQISEATPAIPPTTAADLTAEPPIVRETFCLRNVSVQKICLDPTSRQTVINIFLLP